MSKGIKRICKNCGKEFTLPRYTPIRYCSDFCKKEARRKRDETLKELKRQYAKESESTLDEMARRAKAAGMSYGKYIEYLEEHNLY